MLTSPDPMKPMVILSAGIHLFLAAGLFLFHYFAWTHPKIKPHLLSVQLVSSPQHRVEERKSLPVEPVKKIEPAPRPKVRKQTAPIPLQPVKKKKGEPSPVVVQPKIENPPAPPLVEAKIEEIIPVEAEKIEIAQISEINPNYADWIRRKIESNWNPLPFKGVPKEVTLSFEILKSGLVKFPKVIKSSGDPFFDQAAQRAVVESRVFGELPSDYPKSWIEITCTFSQNKGL